MTTGRITHNVITNDLRIRHKVSNEHATIVSVHRRDRLVQARLDGDEQKFSITFPNLTKSWLIDSNGNASTNTEGDTMPTATPKPKTKAQIAREQREANAAANAEATKNDDAAVNGLAAELGAPPEPEPTKSRAPVTKAEIAWPDTFDKLFARFVKDRATSDVSTVADHVLVTTDDTIVFAANTWVDWLDSINVRGGKTMLTAPIRDGKLGPFKRISMKPGDAPAFVAVYAINPATITVAANTPRVTLGSSRPRVTAPSDDAVKRADKVTTALDRAFAAAAEHDESAYLVSRVRSTLRKHMIAADAA